MPTHPRSPARVVRRHWAALIAPPYLVALVLLRRGFPAGPVFPAAASAGFLLFLVVLLRNLLQWRGQGRIPDREAVLVVAGVAALEIHALVPAVAKSKTVPGSVFFLLGLLLPPGFALPAGMACLAWFPAMAHVPGLMPSEAASTAAMAVVAGTAGAFIRRRLRHPPGNEDAVREAIARSRSMVLPWEDPDPDAARNQPAERSAEGAVLLRREVEIRDGLRRALEGLLPLTGASHAAYLSPSPAPGTAGHVGFLVSVGERRVRDFRTPETYVPVREATVFRRPFLEEGEEAARFAPWERGGGPPPTGIAAVPVLREGAVEGVLLAVREEEGPWTEPVLPLMELAAFFVGRDIDRAREVHRGERYLLREDWYLRMVRRMTQIRRSGDADGGDELRTRRERVYAEAAAQMRRLSDASRVLLVASADGGRKGWIAWEETEAGVRSEERSESIGDSYVGWVIRNGSQRIFSEPPWSPKGKEALPEPWRKAGEQSFLMLPAGVPGGFQGAVVCAHPEERRFQRRHADLVRDIAEIMQLGLSHVEHLEVLTRRATTDGLTGLSNRKAFLQRLEEELSRLDGRHPCAVVMLDIDRFKRINDTYGHPFGDEVLRRVAGILAKTVRKGDAAGRYGGEEFALYLHMTDPGQAAEVAERFRRMIRQAKYHHEGREVAVTASLGVACAPAHGKDAAELLERADRALYLSKQRGRDRVTVYPG